MDQQWTAYSEAPGATRQARYPPHNMTSPQHAPRDASVPSQPTSAPPDGDVAMEDADPYKPKYNAARQPHQNRNSQQFLQQEESSAARRYSPMNLSPTSPYAGSTQQGGANYTSFTPQAQTPNRQSPTRNNPYITTPTNYYSPPCTSHQQLAISIKFLSTDNTSRSF